MSTFIKLYQNKTRPPAPPATEANFNGMTVLVTGSNTGLGYAAALKFAKMGAQHIILGVRDVKKGETAKASISSECPSTQVEVWDLDMLSYPSIQAFAARCDTLPNLHVVCLNAGVYSVTFEKSQYGWEKTLQVNSISTTLLATLLLPKVQQSKCPDGRLPVLELVSSGTHVRVELTAEEAEPGLNLLSYLSDREHFNSQHHYGISKLYAQFAVRKLQEMASNTVEVVGVCPGMVMTELARGYSSLLFTALKSVASALIMRTPDQGANTLITGALLGEKGNGQFWQNDTIKEDAPLVRGEEGAALQAKLWQELLTALKKDVPELSEKARL